MGVRLAESTENIFVFLRCVLRSLGIYRDAVLLIEAGLKKNLSAAPDKVSRTGMCVLLHVAGNSGSPCYFCYAWSGRDARNSIGLLGFASRYMLLAEIAYLPRSKPN